HRAQDDRRRCDLEGRAAADSAGRQLDPDGVHVPDRWRARRRLGRPRLPHRRGEAAAPRRGRIGSRGEQVMIPKRWIEAYLWFLLRRRAAVAFVTAVMTVFFTWQCTHIRVLPQF